MRYDVCPVPPYSENMWVKVVYALTCRGETSPGAGNGYVSANGAIWFGTVDDGVFTGQDPAAAGTVTVVGSGRVDCGSLPGPIPLQNNLAAFCDHTGTYLSIE